MFPNTSKNKQKKRSMQKEKNNDRSLRESNLQGTNVVVSNVKGPKFGTGRQGSERGDFVVVQIEDSAVG